MPVNRIAFRLEPTLYYRYRLAYSELAAAREKETLVIQALRRATEDAEAKFQAVQSEVVKVHPSFDPNGEHTASDANHELWSIPKET